MKKCTVIALLLVVFVVLWAGFAADEAEAPMAASVAAALQADTSEASADLQALPSADGPMRLSDIATTYPASAAQLWRLGPYLGALRRPPRVAFAA